jgi:hypothetical protein
MEKGGPMRRILTTATLVTALTVGCFLADPRPDPEGADGGVMNGKDSGLGAGSDAASTPFDTEVQTDGVAVSGGSGSAGDVAAVGLGDPALLGTMIEVTNATAATAPVTVAAASGGTFVVQVQGQTGDVLRFVVVDGAARGPAVDLTVGDGTAAGAPLAPGDPNASDGMLGFAASLVTVAADGAGNVTVTGAAMATTGGAEVVAGNVTNGATTTATAAADGSFALSFPGDTGNVIVLFARDATGAASQTQVLTVP